MKKYLLLTALVLATTAQADFWSNCTTYGGTIITANKYGDDKGGLCNDPNDTTKINNCNGKKFCVGGNKMNWWSAFTWCEAIGGKVASLTSMCPGATVISDYNNHSACPNLQDRTANVMIWSSTGSGSQKVFMFVENNAIYDGANYGGGVRTQFYYALCEEK
ncbi:MAG: hypothetical protein J6Y85_05855 [Alphaproteobacteria bacterium]|nr:hypothetical protein [Alphaproteobacteria bacterium]